MPMPLHPQLIHDVVTKTAMVIHQDKTYILHGSFKTTSAALDAAHNQYPALYETAKKLHH